jgi:hypothetical protein
MLKQGCVYVMECLGYYKIGKALNYSERRKTIEPKLPEKVNDVCVIYGSDYSQLERVLHSVHRNKRTNGEWFRLDREDVLELHMLAGNITLTEYLCECQGASK